jgi:hypothetical protein
MTLVTQTMSLSLSHCPLSQKSELSMDCFWMCQYEYVSSYTPTWIITPTSERFMYQSVYDRRVASTPSPLPSLLSYTLSCCLFYWGPVSVSIPQSLSESTSLQFRVLHTHVCMHLYILGA